MSDTLMLIFVITVFVGLIIGILGNGFMILVNISDRFKRRKISSVDKILTALAISRLTLMWLGFIFVMLGILCPRLARNTEMFRVTSITWTVTSHFSIWLATCLSIFYCLKIATFSNSFFLYLKWRVKKVVLMTLLASLVLLFSNIVVTEIYVDFWINVYNRNMSNSYRLIGSIPSSKVFLFSNSIFMLMPFTVSLIAFFLLMFSLWKHHRKMQHKDERLRDARPTAHMKALQTGLAFLLLYAMSLLVLVIKMSSSEWMENDIIIFCDHASAIAFPSGHSFVVILGDSKLRRAALSVLWWFRCKSKNAEMSDP